MLRDNIEDAAIEKKLELNYKHNVFEDLQSYSSDMTISQVIKYFQKHKIESFTKTMIQNYVRVNVLPQPADNRYYQKEHLVTLALIESMKKTFSLDEIREFLKLSQDEDTVLSEALYNAYLIYIDKYNAALDEYINKMKKNENKLDFCLELMAISTCCKEIAQILIED